MKYDILIVDDEVDIRRLISNILKDEGYNAISAATGTQALDVMQSSCQPHLVLLDVWLNDPKYDGLDLLDLFLKRWPNVPIIMISGHSTLETAVMALRKGAKNFLEKPFKTDQLLVAIQQALETSELQRENQILRSQVLESDSLIGDSLVAQRINLLISKVAPTNSRVLLTGGGGVGKKTLARMIHLQSRRAKGPFIQYDCMYKNPALIERDLFGETTNNHDIQGAIEKANKGTLLLSNISYLPLQIQKKLASALYEQKFEPQNSTYKINYDVRILSASSEDLTKLVEQKRFLEDLYARISFVSIRVPLLRERRDDILTLFDNYMEIFSKIFSKKPRTLSEEAKVAILNYSWPGNIKQLKNLVEWLLIMDPNKIEGSDSEISRTELPSDFSDKPALEGHWTDGVDLISLPIREAREIFERYYLTAQIAKFAGNVSQTATFIGMERSALHRKLKSLLLTDCSDKHAEDA
jgi:two-component system, NtrC family, nitrogen regulation response regulator NtrX